MSGKQQPSSREDTKLLIELAELWHERGLDLRSRVIYLGSETVDSEQESGVDARLAERVVKNLHVLQRESAKHITLLINNFGGDDYHGLAIIDAIRTSRCEVVGVVRGVAMSMGSWILQACDHRVIGPSSTQMVHYGSWYHSGNVQDVERWIAEGRRVNGVFEHDYVERIRQKRPSFTVEDFRKQADRDWILSAEESVLWGLADELG